MNIVAMKGTRRCALAKPHYDVVNGDSNTVGEV